MSKLNPALLSKKAKESLRKKLYLYVVGLRDLNVAESCYDELKVLPVGDITSINNMSKAFAFIVCYGRIFQHNEGSEKSKLNHSWTL